MTERKVLTQNFFYFNIKSYQVVNVFSTKIKFFFEKKLLTYRNECHINHLADVETQSSKTSVVIKQVNK